MIAEFPSLSPQAFAALRTEIADLAWTLERQGRCDAADVAMFLDSRLRDLATEDLAAAGSKTDTPQTAPAGIFP